MDIRIIHENEYETVMKETAVPALAAARQDLTFAGYDGKPLCYHVFRAEKPSGNLVIVHGFTESHVKYEEMCLYFIRSGLSVYVYDQRGHACSYRKVEDKTITHIDRFEEYVQDLECFVKDVVPKDLPLYLFAHSMGGAVAAMFMEAHPDLFEKAVLSSPMIAPSTGSFPPFVAKAVCGTMIGLGQSKKRLFLSSGYTGEETFKDSCAGSEARFARYANFRREHPDYQNCSPSYRWTFESLKVGKKILKKGLPEGIKTKVLLLAAGKDNMVSNPPQKEFAERVPDCRYEEFPESRHEIFMGSDATMERYVPEVIGFFLGQ
jgi:lysophospholipase